MEVSSHVGVLPAGRQGQVLFLNLSYGTEGGVVNPSTLPPEGVGLLDPGKQSLSPLDGSRKDGEIGPVKRCVSAREME